MASSREPSWGETLDAVLGARLRSVHTAMMGEIRSYSEADQTAEVTLAVQLETADGEFEETAPLAGVPVLWPGAWEAGDRCLLVFCEEAFSKWFDTGSVEPPEVLRRHGLHAVCIPMVAPAGTAVDFVALANLVSATLADLVTRIGAWKTAILALPGTTPVTNATMASAVIVALETALEGWPGPVAATKVKAR
ncbi:MAG: hypothetical protein RL685_4591 [Pseudomonadota bacterium]|jgi:hypothetical protein